MVLNNLDLQEGDCNYDSADRQWQHLIYCKIRLVVRHKNRHRRELGDVGDSQVDETCPVCRGGSRNVGPTCIKSMLIRQRKPMHRSSRHSTPRIESSAFVDRSRFASLGTLYSGCVGCHSVAAVASRCGSTMERRTNCDRCSRNSPAFCIGSIRSSGSLRGDCTWSENGRAMILSSAMAYERPRMLSTCSMWRRRCRHHRGLKPAVWQWLAVHRWTDASALCSARTATARA